MKDHIGISVQVLNATYEPLQNVPLKHAIRMVVRGVAVIEEAIEGVMFGHFQMPKIVRLVRFVKSTWQYARQARYSKNGILCRDNRMCAYCGKTANTVDHLLPRAKGGISSWMNCVSACKKCNNKKSDKTLRESGMKLLYEPFEPNVFMSSGRVIFA